MELISQARAIVQAYNAAADSREWQQQLRVEYTLGGGKNLTSRTSQPGLVSWALSSWHRQAQPKQCQELVCEVARRIFTFIQEENQTRASMANGWEHGGRWLASMPDAGMETLSILSKVGSTPGHPLQVPSSDQLVERLGQLARAHLERIAYPDEEVIRSDIWSHLVNLADAGSIDKVQESRMSDFLQRLNDSQRFHSSDLTVALWAHLSTDSPQQTIRRYYNLSSYILSSGFRELLMLQNPEELNERARLLYREQQKRPSIFYHPVGFLPLVDALVDHQNRVIPAPSVKAMGPFLNYVELSPLDIKYEDWRAQWLSKNPDPTDAKLMNFAALLTSKMEEGYSPDFKFFYEASMAFSGDKLVAVNQIVWESFDFYAFEAFAWKFCKGCCGHYIVFMKALGLTEQALYTRQVARLKAMMQHYGVVQEEWLKDEQLDPQWYAGKRDQIKAYIKRSMRELGLPLFRVAQIGAQIIENTRDCALRLTAEHWFQLTSVYLDTAYHTTSVDASSM